MRTTTASNHGRRQRKPQQVLGPVTWENATWANGRALCDWVCENIAPERLAACDVRPMLLTWRDRAKVSVWAIDRVFIPLGLHLMQVPEEMWIR